MSSVLSSWFYVLTLGIASLLLIALVFIFYNPSAFLQLTSASGQLVDLTGMNNFSPSDLTTAGSAVIKIGANAYSIANSNTSTLSNVFVESGPFGIAAANDVANAKITGTFMFWLLMLGIGSLSMLLAFIAIKYPAKLFGPQVSALVNCLPKTKSSCSSSCAAPTVVTTPKQSSSNTLNTGSSSAQITAALQKAASPSPLPVTPPPAPKPVTPPAAPAGLTSAQLAALQQIMASLAASQSPKPQA